MMMGSINPESTGMPNTVPAPSSSRMMPIASRVAVKPTPMPRPSRMEGSTLFLLANISARPRMMQLTTIKGRNTPKASSNAGEKAWINSCTMVTNPATMVIKAGMRTLSGMTLRSREITALEHTSTKVVAAPMPMALEAAVVTANVAQQPSTSRSTGFSLMMPLVNSWSKPFFFCAISRAPFHGVVLRNGLVDGVGHRGGGDGGACHGLDLALARRLVLDDLQAALRGLLQELV